MGRRSRAGGSLRKARDPREVPRYTLTEAAGYLRLPPATLRAWIFGRPYPKLTGRGFSAGLIRIPDPDDGRLSFLNLVEAHVLCALRRRHEVPMSAVRKATEYMRKGHGVERLFLRRGLQAGMGRLFIEQYGQLLNIGEEGQLAIMDMLRAYLERVGRDSEGKPFRLFPVTRDEALRSPMVILIDPRISFGSPVIAHRAVKTSTVASRFDAGESVVAIAEDYGLEAHEVEEAIRYERAA